MRYLIHHLILDQARRTPEAPALAFRGAEMDYAALAESVESCARGLAAHGLEPSERVAIYLPKCFEAVIAMFGTAAAGGVFVPVNPVLKPAQVEHILRDCGVRFLITSPDRARLLEEALPRCHELRSLVLTGDNDGFECGAESVHAIGWQGLNATTTPLPSSRSRIDQEMAAILYTSGSTGSPKGVVLSHRNMVAGAESVASYLENRADDRLLAVLPFSFDYGLSQLTTAFYAGASVVLLEYLLPRDVIKAVARERITGLAAVPPLWVQLANLPWPEEAAECLRYITNSGGAMPITVTESLQRALPETKIYLMYGLTEAFRSTYLPPEEVATRPDSMGKAIPNAEVMVVREDGTPCAPGEPGELVHRGALVALGYWNDPERTEKRFRPAPDRPAGVTLPEIAVWSGDSVKMDAEGYLYFVGRRDDMIKCSGYRISPTEVEEVAYASGLVEEAVALGIPHPTLGQGILLVVKPGDGEFEPDTLLTLYRRELPNFMQPQELEVREALPRNQNGKIDRNRLAAELKERFQ